MNIGETIKQMERDIEGLGEAMSDTLEWRKKLDGALGTIDSSIDGMSKLVKDQVEEQGNVVASLKDRVEELESRRGTVGMGGTRREGKSIAELLHADDGFKAFLAGKTGNFSMEFKGRSLLREFKQDLVGLASGSPSATIPVQALRLPGVANDPRRAIRILDVLPHQPVSDANSFEYLKLSDAYSPNAAVQQGEGAAKQEANIPVILATGTLFTVANHISISTQLLSDMPTLQRWISGLLTYACLLQLENQIIVGSDSVVTGLLEVAPTAMTNTKTSKADKIGEAAANLAMLGWNPNVVLLNPLDEFDIESEKASGGDEQYVSPPSGGKFWRLTPVATPAIAQGTALVFDSSQATIFDRETINVIIGVVNDQFTRNMRTLLVEGRWGWAFAAASAIKRVNL